MKQLSRSTLPSTRCPWDSSKQVPEKAKVCSHEVQDYNPILFHVASLQDPELHYLLVTAGKTTASLHIPDPFILVCNCEVQQSISPCYLLHHLCPEVIITTLATSQIACALLCCPSSRYWGSKVPHKDKDLGT